MRLLQAFFGFVALNPTYILPVLLRNAKPNNGRIRNRAQKVSISIKLLVFLASGAAYICISQMILAGKLEFRKRRYRVSFFSR